MESLDYIESGKPCQTLGATTPKALAPGGSFGVALTDQVAGSRTDNSARNVVLYDALKISK